MGSLRLLLVVPDRILRRAVHLMLVEDDYVVHTAKTGQETMQLAASWEPDVIVLDVAVRHQGLDVCQQIRAWSDLPILVLAEHGQEELIVRALDVGADDYLMRPAELGQLLVRLWVMLQRRRDLMTKSRVVHVAGLTIDLVGRRVQRSGQLIHLTPKEYQILSMLVNNPDRILTQAQLLAGVWGSEAQGTPILRVMIGNLRRKLEPDPARQTIIETVVGIGYRFRVQPDLVALPG